MKAHTKRSYVVGYSVAMTALGLAALLVTFAITDSWWWALLALFLAGPVGRVLLGALWHPPVDRDRASASSEPAEAEPRHALHR